MNLQTMFTANQIDTELRTARLERARHAREAASPTADRQGVARTVGALFSRFQRMPRASSVDAPSVEPRAARA